jgi:hypothetical protein
MCTDHCTGQQYWRKLGDLISSTTILGYHENLDCRQDTPRFLTELRKTAFARIYSADKNVSLFLGRPLRMSKRLCHFQTPGSDSFNPLIETIGPKRRPPYNWDQAARITYSAETRWSALCAYIKEEIMELLFDRDRGNCIQQVRSVGMVVFMEREHFTAQADFIQQRPPRLGECTVGSTSASISNS